MTVSDMVGTCERWNADKLSTRMATLPGDLRLSLGRADVVELAQVVDADGDIGHAHFFE